VQSAEEMKTEVQEVGEERVGEEVCEKVWW